MKNIKPKQVKSLLKALEKENYDKASEMLDQIVAKRNESLIEGVEEIAQNLHDTLEGFGQDAQLLRDTKHGLPDATERLEYVMQTTEEASNKTLSAAENMIGLLESIESQTSDEKIAGYVRQAHAEMTEIMTAQSFQDLTGQVLNRVIMLVTSLEASLKDLIQRSGLSLDAIPAAHQSEAERKAEEEKGMGPNVTRESQKGTVGSQADVDAMLDDLGI
ncbi:protein phosphatase CheZ [Thiomicrospira sp. WB1]|uniref:protein phosphatase CheZ n=1 Tax=Thiomicrospira sp. WB1 TaxID=1685380 RepID=UPI000B2C2153|nr:protein phosphatase CheZ [Thiomicrospira sp. WB1]